MMEAIAMGEKVLVMKTAGKPGGGLLMVHRPTGRTPGLLPR